jgi:uncharacterized protein YecE (DUF72 family)
MKFGKDPHFAEKDLSLPDTHPATHTLLEHATSADKKTVYVGCAKWGIPEWKGILYPKRTKASDYLEHYGKCFNGIELNTTHYGNKAPDTIKKWASKVSDDFRFAPKFPQLISHIYRLKNTHEPTLRFIDSMQDFGIKLGPSFLQLPPNFSPAHRDTLFTYLNNLPTGFEVALELRHEDWFNNAALFNEICEAMQANNISSVITDTAGRRDVIHQRLTTPTAFIRFVGNNLHPSDYRRIDEWVEVIIDWFKRGLYELHFYMHQEDEVNTPTLCSYLIKELHKKQEQLNLVLPQLPALNAQEELF